MDLDKIQEMWQKDSVIDPDNLHDESLKDSTTSLKVLYFVQYYYLVARASKRTI